MKYNTAKKQNAKIASITDEYLVIGIDVGSSTHYVRAFNNRKIEYSRKPLRFANSKEGFETFRDRAIFVKKTYRNGFNNVAYEQIFIRVKSIATDIADIPFPFFKKGEMYKGMKLEREYTLEELGLKGL